VDRIISRRLFTDGLERDVYEDATGRPYVLDGDGGRSSGCPGRISGPVSRFPDATSSVRMTTARLAAGILPSV